MSADFRATQRSIANRTLTKILLMGLGCSILLHAVAITGISYWAHNYPDEQMEIVEIDRVEVAPEASPTPSTKPTSIPEPKVIKPPVAASIPTPIPVKVPTPQTILIPIRVVKTTKSAVIKSSTLSHANIVSPATNRVALPVKIAAINSLKLNPIPSFSDRLFNDPLPRNIPSKPAIETRTPTPKISPQQAKIATQKIENNPPQSSPIKYPQPTTADNQTALAPNNLPAKSAPNSISDPTTNLPTDEKLIPSSPANTSKLSQTPEREIIGEDRTKSPPGNNTQMMQNNGVKLGNQTNLGEGDRRKSSIGSGLNSNDNSNSGISNQPSVGTPGNITTGSSKRVSIQCLRNCEISYPDELENSDIGKDKILVKVTIDPDGAVTNAEIDRSSGNQNLDRVTLEGVKQMQLNATGQTRTHRIKISTLVR
jgi:TonB family protein